MAPQTKATFAHEMQDQVLELPTADRERVVAACGPVWGEIRNALPGTWLDEATFNTLNETCRNAVGDHDFRQLYRQVGRRLVKNPNFQNAIEALVRIFGVHPHTLLKLTPRVRQSLVKDSGVMTYKKVDACSALLRVEGFPASTWRLGTTSILLAGCFEGGVEVMNAVPDVTIEDLDLEGGSAQFSVRWTSNG